VVVLNMLRGRLRRESGEGRPAVDAYEVALAATQRPADRCRALLGIAAGHRLLTGVDAALAALAEAEPLARADGLARELSELHYTRGSLNFARGDIAACRAEHHAALACARSLSDPGWEARAVSGLADADYADGRMKSALAQFEQCVLLCTVHGLMRVAIPNRVLIGFCRGFLVEFDKGVADIEAARSLAVQVGDRHGEMMALVSQGVMLTYGDRFSDAEPLLERGLELAETIGSRRFQSFALAGMSACALAADRMDEARGRIERSLALSRATGMGFCGPLALGIKARLQDDAREREQCRAEAEVLLAQGCTSHNSIDYHRHGIEDALARGEFARGLEHAAAIEAYTRGEPLPYCDFLIARARVLVGLASRPEDRALQAELARLRAAAERVRWPIAWPVLAGGP
jgi:tetratricopeptide (TPR) repeat protein